MRRVANSQAIIGEGVVLILVGRDVDIAIVEVAVCVVPVAARKVSQCLSACMRAYSYVLSNPIPCVKIWIVAQEALVTLGAQNCALMSYLPEVVAYPDRATSVKLRPCWVRF